MAVKPLRDSKVRSVELSDGRTISARIWPGKGPPLVLLHGLLDSVAGWEALAVRSPRRCVALDLPGFGGSSRVRRARLRYYADDVIEALDLLGIDGHVLVGHSLGGAIAAAVADRVPARVDGLALLAPAGFGRIRLAEAVSIPLLRNGVAVALPFVLRNRLALTAAYMTIVTAGQLPEPAVLSRVSEHARDSVPGARDATQAIVVAGLAEHSLGRRRLRYRGPTAVMWGRRDRLVPISHLEAVTSALPQATTDVGDFGHHPQQECPERLDTLIEDLCARCSARRAA